MTALHRIEGGVLVAAFLVSMSLPLVDALGRWFGGFSVPGSASYRAQLTLWLAFLGGLLATRENRHLTLSTAEAIGAAKVRDAARLFSSSVAAASSVFALVLAGPMSRAGLEAFRRFDKSVCDRSSFFSEKLSCGFSPGVAVRSATPQGAALSASRQFRP